MSEDRYPETGRHDPVNGRVHPAAFGRSSAESPLRGLSDIAPRPTAPERAEAPDGGSGRLRILRDPDRDHWSLPDLDDERDGAAGAWRAAEDDDDDARAFDGGARMPERRAHGAGPATGHPAEARHGHAPGGHDAAPRQPDARGHARDDGGAGWRTEPPLSAGEWTAERAARGNPAAGPGGAGRAEPADRRAPARAPAGHAGPDAWRDRDFGEEPPAPYRSDAAAYRGPARVRSDGATDYAPDYAPAGVRHGHGADGPGGHADAAGAYRDDGRAARPAAEARGAAQGEAAFSAPGHGARQAAPASPHGPAHSAASLAAAPSAPAPTEAAHGAIPADFGFENEHPVLRIPFVCHIDGRRFEGDGLSITHLHLRGDGSGPLGRGRRLEAWVQVPFAGFSVVLQPVVCVVDERRDGGAITLQFADPTGDHLPQLRYVLNSYIAGDVVSLNGMLSYTGNDAPREPAADPAEAKARRKRSLSRMALSLLCLLVAGYVVFTRYTTAHEMHPVFVERAGQQMRATTAGQIGYLNPQAQRGEVLYAINGNSGDVLNFQMPCDCAVSVQTGIEAGTTVLPTDLVATVFREDADLRVQSLMSVEGLARAMRGDHVWLDLNDGRSLAVEVIPGAAARSAARGGEVFVPVDLRVREGAALTAADIGKTGRLRLTPNLLARAGLS